MRVRGVQNSPQKIFRSKSSQMPLLKEIINNSKFTDDNKSLEKNNKLTSPNQNAISVGNFYQNECVLIMGATTFVGKVLLAKLLFHFPEIDHIYLLLELKKEESMNSKIADLLNDRIFTYTNFHGLNVQNKITGIKFEFETHISDIDKNLLQTKVSIIFNVSAPYAGGRNFLMFLDRTNVSFLCGMSQNMENLKSFVHLSTALIPNLDSLVREEFYNYSVVKQFRTDRRFPFFQRYENIYRNYINPFIMKKIMAEEIVQNWSGSNEQFPVGIVRSGIMSATSNEPVVGYVGDCHGINTLTAAVSSGYMNIMMGNSSLLMNLVPVDKVAYALIVGAWDISMQTARRGSNILIYNFVSTEDTPITWNEFIKYVVHYSRTYPYLWSVWYCTFGLTKFNWYYNLCTLTYYWIPAVIRDLCKLFTRRKARAIHEFRQHERFMKSIRYITSNEWRFDDSNVKDMWSRMSPSDQNTFNFSMCNFNWSEYLLEYICGVRTFIHHDDMKTIEESRKRYRRLYWMHLFAKGTILASFFFTGYLTYWKIGGLSRSIFKTLSVITTTMKNQLIKNISSTFNL